jgi:Glycosyltransferase
MALRGASRVTVVSREQEHALERCGINTEKIHLVTNGFDDKFDIQNKAEVRNELGLDGNKKILIYIGRLIKGKGIEYLLQALKNVEDNKLVQLVIVGDGGYRRELERKTAELHLQDKVSFRGEQKHDVVHRWLGASDIFCLPSLSEGCPTVVIEALACGRAVIASEVGEIPRLINDDNGILFEPANAEQIKGAIEKAMDKQWNEEKIRDSVRFATWENIAKKYYGIYERALACE